MDDIRESIAAIEKEIRETPYHKGTEHHIGRLRARLAKLMDRELGIETRKSGGGGYAIKKNGDATVVLVGPPSVGKSTLLNRLTNAQSKVAPYAFTTVSVIPGMLKYNDAYIQILDVPGLLEGASEGKGRGRQVISVARAADLLLVMSDVGHLDYLDKIKTELHKSGIRLDSTPPTIQIIRKVEGGINIISNFKQELGKETVAEMAREFGLTNADIVLKEKVSFDGLIDALSGNRVYIPSVFVVNKIDLSASQKDRYFGISAKSGERIEELKAEIWRKLGLLKFYLVGSDDKPNRENPIIAKKGQTLADVAGKISSGILETKKLAKIWGPGAQFPGQEKPLSTLVAEGMLVRFI